MSTVEALPGIFTVDQAIDRLLAERGKIKNVLIMIENTDGNWRCDSAGQMNATTVVGRLEIVKMEFLLGAKK